MQVDATLRDPAVLNRCSIMQRAVAVAVQLGERMEHMPSGFSDRLLVSIHRGYDTPHSRMVGGKWTTALIIHCSLAITGMKSFDEDHREAFLFVNDEGTAAVEIHLGVRDQIPEGSVDEVVKELVRRLADHFSKRLDHYYPVSGQ